MKNTIISTNDYINNLAAIEPCYGKYGGNATRIYTKTGNIETVTFRLRTILRRITTIFGYNLSTLRANYCEHFACGLNVPLPLSAKLVLVPLKMRLPHTGDDGATGYVNLLAVKNVTKTDPENQATGEKCRIHLEGGISIPCCLLPSTVKKRLVNGRHALTHHKYQQNGYGNVHRPHEIIIGNIGPGDRATYTINENNIVIHLNKQKKDDLDE